MPFSSLFGRKGSRKSNATKGKPLEGIKAREESSEESTHKEEGVIQNCAHENGDVRESLEIGVETSQVTNNLEESSLPQAIDAKETEHEIPLERKECGRDELCICLKSQENSDNQNMHCAASQHENNDAVETKESELGFNISNSSSAHDIKISESENRGGISHQESEHCSKQEQENVIIQQNTTEETRQMPSNEDDSKFEKILDNHKGVIESDVNMMCSEEYDRIEKVESSESSSDLLAAPRKDEANEYQTKQSEIINPICDVSAKSNDSEKPNQPFKDSSETNTNVLEARANETKNHTDDIKSAEKESAVQKKEMDDKNGESVCPTAKVPLDDVVVDSSNGDQDKPEMNGCEVSEGENSRTEDLCDIEQDSVKTSEIQPNMAEETVPNTDFSDRNDDKVADMDSQFAEKILHVAQPGSDSAEVQIKSEDVLEEADGSTSSKLNNRSEEHSTESYQRDHEDFVPQVQTEVNSSVMSTADSLKQKTETQESHEGCITDEKQAANIQVNTEDSNLRTQINPDLMNSEDHNSCEHSGDTIKPKARTAAPLDDISHCISVENDDFLTVPNKATIIEQHPVPSWKVGNLQVKLPTKSRGRGKLKAWKQRWVVFQMDEFVKDAKDPSLMINIYASECSTARSHSPLFWCTVSASKTVLYRSQSRTHKYAFSISVDGDVILHLAADSETASQEWMAAIRNLLWPQNQVLQLEKMLHGSEFEVSVIDNDFSFHAGLLGSYGNMKVNSNKLIFRHPQTEHVIQEWYLNTLDKFQLLPQNKEEDAYKVVVMHTGQDSSTGSGQIILFCPEAVAMLQSIASTIHKYLQYRTTVGKEQNQQELADLAEWLNPVMSCAPKGELTEEYYKVPRRQIRSLLDIPNFAFDKPLGFEDHPQVHEDTSRKSVLMTSSTSLSTFSHDSGISLATQSDDFLNCSVTSFTIGGRPVRSHTSSESSDAYSPPCTPEIQRKQNQEPEET